MDETTNTWFTTRNAEFLNELSVAGLYSEIVLPNDASIAITEVNYNPAAPTAEELAGNTDLNNDDFEFIEFYNYGTETVDISNFAFIDGIEFRVPTGTLLQPHEYAVIVNDTEAFALRYDSEPRVLGQFDMNLSNGGERIELVDAFGRTVVEFAYDDSERWPAAAAQHSPPR